VWSRCVLAKHAGAYLPSSSHLSCGSSQIIALFLQFSRARMRSMHFKILQYLWLALTVSVTFNTNALAQESRDFAGDWTLTLGNHPFILLTLTPAANSAGHFNGLLVRPQHFTMSGATFSSIKGPIIQEPVIHSTASGNCLSFTTQNPRDKSDETDYQLCLTDNARGTLKLIQLGLEPWPVTRGKGPLLVATDWDNTRSYIPDDGYESNPEMQQIFSEDQKDREPSSNEINWLVVDKADAARRIVTSKLLNAGKLHTGEDFERAAFVFQHGDTPDDYLLAHTLAVVAVTRGQSSAIWIAAATLDRYLDSIHQPQIYGTQFHTKPNEQTTQEPYNRSLISDAVRRQLGVPSQAAQEEQRKKSDAERFHP
jgi:hypothetical protein